MKVLIAISVFLLSISGALNAQNLQASKESELVTANIELPEAQAYLQTQQSLLLSMESHQLPIHEMTVTHFEGEVTLSGYVDTAADAAKAAKVASNVPGVKKVNNFLVPRYEY